MEKKVHFRAERWKNTDNIKKKLKKKLFRIKFSTKNFLDVYLYLANLEFFNFFWIVTPHHFKNVKSLEAPSFTPGEDRDTRPQSSF